MVVVVVLMMMTTCGGGDKKCCYISLLNVLILQENPTIFTYLNTLCIFIKYNHHSAPY